LLRKKQEVDAAYAAEEKRTGACKDDAKRAAEKEAAADLARLVNILLFNPCQEAFVRFPCHVGTEPQEGDEGGEGKVKKEAEWEEKEICGTLPIWERNPNGLVVDFSKAVKELQESCAKDANQKPTFTNTTIKYAFEKLCNEGHMITEVCGSPRSIQVDAPKYDFLFHCWEKCEFHVRRLQHAGKFLDACKGYMRTPVQPPAAELRLALSIYDTSFFNVSLPWEIMEKEGATYQVAVKKFERMFTDEYSKRAMQHFCRKELVGP
jgi:hypothetical protein